VGDSWRAKLTQVASPGAGRPGRRPCYLHFMSMTRLALLYFALHGCAPAGPASDISRDEPLVEPEPAAPPGVTATPPALASASAPVVTRDARDCSMEFRERLDTGGPVGRIEGVPCLPKEDDGQCVKRAEAVVKRGANERIVGMMTSVKPSSFEADVEIDGVVEHWLAADTSEVSLRADAVAKAGHNVKLLRAVASKTGKRQALLLLTEMRPLAPSTKTQARIQWQPKLAAPAALTAMQNLATELGVTIISYTPLDTGGLEITLECGG
jgi:hypothetical protein